MAGCVYRETDSNVWRVETADGVLPETFPTRVEAMAEYQRRTTTRQFEWTQWETELREFWYPCEVGAVVR